VRHDENCLHFAEDCLHTLLYVSGSGWRSASRNFVEHWLPQVQLATAKLDFEGSREQSQT